MPKIINGQPQARASIIDDPTTALQTAQELHVWIINDFLTSGLADARQFPVVKVLLALGVLKLYLGVFGGDEGVQDRVYTQERVEMLLACQASEYTEVRSRARSL